MARSGTMGSDQPKPLARIGKEVDMKELVGLGTLKETAEAMTDFIKCVGDLDMEMEAVNLYGDHEQREET